MDEIQPLSPDTQKFLLEQLKDVADPAAISWWPPAPGWWVLGLLLLVLSGLLVWRAWRRHQRDRYRREAGSTLEQLVQHWRNHADSRQYLDGAASLLRQIGITHRGRSGVAGLTGSAWYELVNGMSSSTISRNALHALTEARYAPYAGNIDIEALHSELKAWLAGLEEQANV